MSPPAASRRVGARGWTLGVAILLSGCLAPAATDDALDATSIGVDGFSTTSVFPGTYSFDTWHSRVLVSGTADILPVEVVELESEVDGALVQMAVIRPDVAGPVPVIAMANVYWFQLTDGAIELDDTYERIVPNFVPHGYAVAFIPVRGSADNGGCADYLGPAERADLDLAVTWLADQPWSNGNVGMMGLSYGGSTPWAVAAEGNPHLKTIVSIAGVSDWHHLMYRNGTAEERGPDGGLIRSYWFQNYVRRLADAADDPLTGGPWSPTARRPEHATQTFACPTAVQGLAASEWSTLNGERDPLGFWADRNLRPDVLANYEGSVFIVQGLQDWNVDPSNNYPWVYDLEAKGLVVKHLLHQADHRWPDTLGDEGDPANRADFSEILLHWFDRWLKGDTGADLGPRVQVQDSSGAWRDETAWPPADSAPVEFWLTPEGMLVREPSATTGSNLVLPSTPGEVLGFDMQTVPRTCTACATFTTGPLEDGLRFAGIPQVHVTVTPAAPTQEIVAALYMVDGATRTQVGRGNIDVAWADGTERPRPATPGEALLVRMVLEPLDVAVPPGAALELEFHGGATEERMPGLPPTAMRLEVGGEQSVFRVLAFERGPEAFFVPPGSPVRG